MDMTDPNQNPAETINAIEHAFVAKIPKEIQQERGRGCHRCFCFVVVRYFIVT